MHAFAVERRQLLGTKSRAMLTISRGKERLNTNNDNMMTPSSGLQMAGVPLLSQFLCLLLLLVLFVGCA